MNPQVFGLHANPNFWVKLMLGLIPVVFMVSMYITASNARLAENPQDRLLPSFSQMGDAIERAAFEENKRTGERILWTDTGSSMIRIFTGVVAGAVVGLFLGLNMGLFPGMRSMLLPTITVLSIVPPLSLLPMLFLTLGVGEASKIVLIFIGVVFVITRDIYLTTRAIPAQQITKALTLGATELGVTYRVVLPQILPRLLDSTRLSLGAAWLFLIAAEGLASESGLGYRIFLMRRYMGMDTILPYVAWITLIGFTFDYALQYATQKFFPWYKQGSKKLFLDTMVGFVVNLWPVQFVWKHILSHLVRLVAYVLSPVTWLLRFIAKWLFRGLAYVGVVLLWVLRLPVRFINLFRSAPEVIEHDGLLHFGDVYQQYGPNVVLDNIDLTVARGEFVTVIGPSGCGKSTLLRLVIGQEQCTGGTVSLEGNKIHKPSETAGVVYQDYSLFPNLTVMENILSAYRFEVKPWEVAGVRKQYHEKAMEFLSRAGVADHAHKYPNELSGGQRQRVAIVQSLMKAPRVLCMDEPFSALDPGTREDMQLFLLELWEELGMTIFFVTHELEEAAYLGTRLIAVSKYYEDERGYEVDDDAHGAKIIVDEQLREKGTAASPEVKQDPKFAAFIRHVLNEAFDPEHIQHAKSFNLNHPDSWQTLTDAEAKT